MTQTNSLASEFASNLLSSAMRADIWEDRNIEMQKEEIKFIIAIAATAFAGLIFIIIVYFLPSPWSLRRGLLQALGEALVIASVLAFTVDKYMKGFLIREVTRDLFKYLVGYKLPEPIQNRLRDLMGTSFVREKYQATLSLIPQSEDEVLVDIKIQFEMKNISTSTQPYEARIEVEKHDNPRILELRCDQKDAAFLKIAPLGGTIGVESPTVPGVIIAVGEKVNLIPQTVYPMSGHYQLRVPCNHSDTLSFLYPTVDVTVKAECPDNFRVVIEGASVETHKMWQFGARAFLKDEHIRIRWFKTEDSATEKNKLASTNAHL